MSWLICDKWQPGLCWLCCVDLRRAHKFSPACSSACSAGCVCCRSRDHFSNKQSHSSLQWHFGFFLIFPCWIATLISFSLLPLWNQSVDLWAVPMRVALRQNKRNRETHSGTVELTSVFQSVSTQSLRRDSARRCSTTSQLMTMSWSWKSETS